MQRGILLLLALAAVHCSHSARPPGSTSARLAAEPQNETSDASETSDTSETGETSETNATNATTATNSSDGVKGVLDTGAERPDNNWKYVMGQQTCSNLAVALVLFLTIALVFSIQAIRSDKATMMFRIRCSGAWLSCAQLIVMTLPLVIKSWRDAMPAKVAQHLAVMAFWNAFTNSDSYGTFVMWGVHMLIGVLLATFTMSFWNLWFPGGVACIYARECPEHTTWLMSRQTGEYCTIAFATLCIFSILLSRLWVDAKRIYLLTLSGLFCSFLNPSGDWTDFSPFLADWNPRMSTCGSGILAIVALILGVGIRGPLQFWLPMKTLTRGAITYGCLDQLEAGMSKLVLDNVQALRLMLNWVNPESASQADSVRELLAGTEAHLGHSRRLASDAWWEVVFSTSKLRHFHWCLDIFDEIGKANQFLVLLAEETFDGDEDEDEMRIHRVVAPYLAKFIDVYSGTLWVLFDTNLSSEERKSRVGEALELAAALLERIMQEVRALARDAEISSEEAREQLAFFHAAGTWTFAVRKGMTLYESTHLEPWSVVPHLCTYFTTSIHDRAQWVHATTITSAWMAAFLFSCYYTHYRSTVVGTLSLMIIDKTLILDIFDRLQIRILGLSLGVVTANMPAYILCHHYTTFVHMPEALVAYVSVMLILWGLLMYASVIGGRLIYTFQTYAAFGSVELVRPLLLIYQEKPKSDEIKVSSFNSIIYSACGMFILAVALVLMVFVRSRLSKDSVELHLSRALRAAQRLVESFRSGGEDAEEAGKELQQALAEVEEAVNARRQTAYIFSDDVSDEVLQLVLVQCRTAQSLAQSLKLLEGDLSVDVTGIMSRLLAEPTGLGVLAEFIQKDVDLANMKLGEKATVSDRAAAAAARMSPEKEQLWLKQIKEAEETQALKELAATWSFELSAIFVNATLAKIEVYIKNHEQSQQLAEAQSTAMFSEVCKDVRQLLEEKKKKI